MLRFYRKTLFARWHVNRKAAGEKRNFKEPKKAFAIYTATQNHKHSNQNDQKKQHANKQDKYWDDPQFHFKLFQTSLLETAGWLGTAALYFSYHLKHINSVFEYDKTNSSCIFSNIVLAMPRRSCKKENSITPTYSFSLPSNIHNETGKKIAFDTDALESIITLSDKYISAVQNSTGIRLINKNDKKAFRHFQNSARLGSSQGFYNLGLCYHFGKGTKVNLNMAAFCYRKAAMKGHGLASFNLAIFFYKGLGGLPVDHKLARDLLAAAAEKGVPEAQLYFGIEFLEEEKCQEAVQIFRNLAEKNVSHAQPQSIISHAQYYLGTCYESGLGVDKNENIARELFIKSAAQGNKRAFEKLQLYREKESLNSIKSNIAKFKGQRCIHVSSSVPELSAIVKKTVQNTTFTISSYLGLIPPFLLASNSDVKSKDNFFIGEKSLVKECSNTHLPVRNIPFMLQVKT